MIGHMLPMPEPATPAHDHAGHGTGQGPELAHSGMGGMVLGVTVLPDASAKAAEPPAWHAERKLQLRTLYHALKRHAAEHGGKFPAGQSDPGLEADLWSSPHPSGVRYLYVPPTDGNGKARPLAYEPEVFGPERYVLFTDGEVRNEMLDALVAWIDLVIADPS